MDYHHTGRISRRYEPGDPFTVDGNFKRIYFDISPSIIEKLMINTTISTWTLGRWNVTTEAVVSEWVNTWKFNQELIVFISFGSSLLLALACLIIGTKALAQNGVPVESESFLQVSAVMSGADDDLRKPWLVIVLEESTT